MTRQKKVIACITIVYGLLGIFWIVGLVSESEFSIPFFLPNVVLAAVGVLSGIGIFRSWRWVKWMGVLFFAIQVPQVATPTFGLSFTLGISAIVSAVWIGSGTFGVNIPPLAMLAWSLCCLREPRASRPPASAFGAPQTIPPVVRRRFPVVWPAIGLGALLAFAGYYVHALDSAQAEKKISLIDHAAKNEVEAMAITYNLPKVSSAMQKLESERSVARSSEDTKAIEDRMAKLLEAYQAMIGKVNTLARENDTLVAEYGSLPRQLIWQRELDSDPSSSFSLEKYKPLPNQGMQADGPVARP